MKGKILNFDENTNTGKISGYDGNRYDFTKNDWKSNVEPIHGNEVDFSIQENSAKEIYCISSQTNNYGKSNILSKFQPITFIGVGLGLLFFIFCLIPPLSLRWWVIMPFGLASSIIFFLTLKKVKGIESKVCFYGIMIILGIFLIRDIVISSTCTKMIKAGQEIYDYYSE